MHLARLTSTMVYKRWSMRQYYRALGILLILPVSVALGAPAGDDCPPPEDSQPVRADEPAQGWERPSDPPAPTDEIKRQLLASYPTFVNRDGFVSVQVNVATGGLNIQGDAANEPSIAVDPTAPNRIVIGWRQFDSVTSDFRQAGWAYSGDGGRSWTFPGVLDPGVFRSDPVLAADAEGRIYYHSLTIVSEGYGTEVLCDLYISEDGGTTWSDPLFAFGGDKNWMTVDATDAPGSGYVYLSWRPGDNHHAWSAGWFARLTDHGQTAGDSYVSHPPPQRGTMAVGPDGEVYAAGVAGSADSPLVVYRSLDASQADVDPPSFESFDLDIGGDLTRGHNYDGVAPNPAGMLGQVWIGTDHSSTASRGWVYVLASVDPPGEDPMDVHFVRSTDGGGSWSEPIRIHGDDQLRLWQWFGTMAVAPGGRIDAVWVETADGDTQWDGELRYSYSKDGGFSWEDSVALSPSFDSWLGFPQQGKIGDYYHMISDDVGAHLAYAATFNQEQDVYYLRIGDWDCNSNGFGDASDLASGVEDDCDLNGVPDSCEIAAAVARDVNDNGVLDRCERPPRRPRGRLRSW